MKQLVTISPNIQSGVPVFFNIRVPVKNLFDYIRGGDLLEDFLEDFPSVAQQQAQGILKLVENTVTHNYYIDENIGLISTSDDVGISSHKYT
jgi:uncharacterized protein (DUF433 family)